MQSTDIAFGSPPRHDRFMETSGDRQRTSWPDDTAADGTVHSTTTYKDYPVTQPFIYDDYRRDPDKPTTPAYPESNRQAVMSALRGLQDKIRRLELERSHAEDNLRTLATETSRYRDILHQDRGVGSGGDEASDSADGLSEGLRPGTTHYDSRLGRADITIGADTTHGTEVHGKLESAEQRCQLLERQLDCMRKMVSSAEQDRSRAVQRSVLMEKQRQEDDLSNIHTQLDKISELERDHLKLTATQTLAESKIRELEEKLREERHYRKIMQDKAAELETAAEANRIILQATGTHQPSAKRTKKKKKKAPVQSTRGTNGVLVNGTRCSRSSGSRPVSASSSGKQPGMEPLENYKLNLAEIPFIAGKSTGPSHSLAANFQEVLSIMKTHNPQLCTSPRSHARNAYRHFSPSRSSGLRVSSASSKARKTLNSAMGASSAELTDLLLQLQEEFTELTAEHEELSHQITDCQVRGAREDLERELDRVVAKMEAKGDQIARLRAYQEKLYRSRTKKKLTSTGGSASSGYGSTGGTMPSATINGEVEVTTTVRTKGKNVGPLIITPDSSSKAQASLNLYKDLKKIQTTLRKDDVTWE